MRVLAVGASGLAGSAIAELLAPRLSASDELVLAGRRRDRLSQLADRLDGPSQISTLGLDLDDEAALPAAVDGADLVIVTASRPDRVAPLAQATIAAGADWFDTMLSVPSKHAALRALEPDILAAGRCFVTDGGFHPGLPGALVRWAGEQLDDLVEADVMGGLRVDWHADQVADSTIEEMLGEFTDFDMSTWIGGERRRLRWSECPTVEFGAPIGRQIVVPMPLAEMTDLPQRYPGLQRCGFYISGFGPAMDYAVLPLLMVMSRIRALRRPTVRFTRWSMHRLASTPPPHRLEVQLRATGHRHGRPTAATVIVSGEDGYLLTAAPAVACLQRVVDGSIRTPGLHLQAHLVSPRDFLSDLTAFGLDVEASVSPLGPNATAPASPLG